MGRDYIRQHKPDDDDLNYEQSKQLCEEKGIFWQPNEIQYTYDIILSFSKY